MIIDTSAIIAIFYNEPDAAGYAEAIARTPVRRISVGNWLEVTMVLSRVGSMDAVYAAGPQCIIGTQIYGSVLQLNRAAWLVNERQKSRGKLTGGFSAVKCRSRPSFISRLVGSYRQIEAVLRSNGLRRQRSYIQLKSRMIPP